MADVLQEIAVRVEPAGWRSVAGSDRIRHGEAVKMKERSILVIEDDPLNRKLVHALLSFGGYNVLEAGSAEEGLALAREKTPDCILMDIRLPGREGMSAMRLLKQDPALRTIPVIALTASAMSGDEEKAIEAGCDAYITKPIDSALFMGTVQSLMQRAAPPAEVGNGRVLIVDDEPIVVDFLATQLHNAGWETVKASGGEEAIRAAREAPPDLILMDVLMPGINGYEATRRLKADQRTAGIPIILVTGLNGIEDTLSGLDAGADEFLSKPVSTAELIVRIRNMLRLKQYEEQLSRRPLPAIDPAGGQALESAAAGASQPSRILLLQRAGGGEGGVRRHLEEMGYRVALSENVEDEMLAVRQGAADLVVLDAAHFGSDGLEMCRRLKENSATRRIPLMVIAGQGDPEGRIHYLSLGAEDLLPPPVDHRELAARVARLLRQKAHLDTLQSRYQAALLASNNDGLTGLFNNAYFKRILDLEVKRSQRKNHPTSLVMLDLDDFKSMNDTRGHAAGDLILSEVGRRIRSSIREIDLPARFGGEEFAVVLPYTDRAGAVVVAERIRDALASQEFAIGIPVSAVRITASIGVATCPEHATQAEDLIRLADTLLYRAKMQGKNKVCCQEG
jgi:two-component system cell cycle response regulator